MAGAALAACCIVDTVLVMTVNPVAGVLSPPDVGQSIELSNIGIWAKTWGPEVGSTKWPDPASQQAFASAAIDDHEPAAALYETLIASGPAPDWKC
jgi:hypothetical protein